MQAVKNTVRTGRTVVCTIHQPSLEIFQVRYCNPRTPVGTYCACTAVLHMLLLQSGAVLMACTESSVPHGSFRMVLTAWQRHRGGLHPMAALLVSFQSLIPRLLICMKCHCHLILLIAATAHKGLLVRPWKSRGVITELQ